MPRRAIQIDEAKALALLRDGVPARRVRKIARCRLGRILDLARANGIELAHGPAKRPFDEARALALLREGMPAYKVRNAVGAGHLRSIVRLARRNGIGLRSRRTDGELRIQDRRIERMRLFGYSWEQIAAKLGYARGAMQSIIRRARRESEEAGIRMHARTRRAILRRLRSFNAASGWEDVDSFVRLSADPRRQWLLSPEERDLARERGLLATAQ